MIYQLDSEYYVKGFKQSDITSDYLSWFQDQDICRYNSHGKFFRSDGYYSQYAQNVDSDRLVVWAICHCKDGHVGNVSLQNLSFINRNAEFAIILGKKPHMGKGLALKASQVLLFHGFHKLNLERVYCGTATSNGGMNKLAHSLGMSLEGCRRRQLFLEGDWVDVNEYGVLRHEFKYSLETE